MTGKCAHRPLQLTAIALAAGLTILAGVSSAMMAPKTAVAAPAVDALNVTTVVDAGGKFRMDAPGRWIEEGSKGETFSFVEEKRDAPSIFLFDAKRDMRLQIDLQRRQILILQKPSQWRLLYAITGASGTEAAGKAASSPAAAGAADIKTVLHANGAFRMENPKQWVEEGKDGAKFYYEEEKRDASSIHLLDAGRKMRLQLDLKRRQVLFSQDAAPFAPLYPITSATAAVTRGLTTEQRCSEALQGKVAWNRQGDKRWQPDNVRKLCGDTNLVASAVECFEKELRAQGDAQRAIASCTEGRRQVQVLYVIPKGQQAKPDAEKALAAIMMVVQRHYFQQLGVTFELRNPLVSVVAIDETAEKLRDASGTLMFERAQRLAKTEFKRDYEYRENVIVTVFEGLQVGAGMGGANLAAVAEPFWRPAYETFKRAPSELPKAQDLHAWPHEMGHGFGLMHTVDAQECLKRFGINLGPLPSLIMQKRETRPTVYEYPFVAEEKQLLLNESYYPNCRPLLGPRSHASTYLRHRMPVQAGTN